MSAIVRPTVSYPGVYVQELPAAARAIRGVETSITAFLGRAWMGPVNAPVRLLGWADYERVFGGLQADYPLSYAVLDYFANGGAVAVVVRLVSGAAAGGAPEPARAPEGPPPPAPPPTPPPAPTPPPVFSTGYVAVQANPADGLWGVTGPAVRAGDPINVSEVSFSAGQGWSLRTDDPSWPPVSAAGYLERPLAGSTYLLPGAPVGCLVAAVRARETGAVGPATAVGASGALIADQDGVVVFAINARPALLGQASGSITIEYFIGPARA